MRTLSGSRCSKGGTRTPFTSGGIMHQRSFVVAVATFAAVACSESSRGRLNFAVSTHQTPATGAWLAANPGFTGLSVKVTGTFSHGGTRSDFTFTSDLDAKQKVELSPSLVVTEGTPADLTLRFDISTWFMTETRDALIDPA